MICKRVERLKEPGIESYFNISRAVPSDQNGSTRNSLVFNNKFFSITEYINNPIVVNYPPVALNPLAILPGLGLIHITGI